MYSVHVALLLFMLIVGNAVYESVAQQRQRPIARQPVPKNRPIARQPLPSQNRHHSFGNPSSECTPQRVTSCLGSLMRLNITALVETFKVYELLSFTDVDESKLREQAKLTSDTCSLFNEFNDCTGGDFLKCFDKKRFIGMIQGLASIAIRPGSSSGLTSVLNDIAPLITDQQIDFVGRAMIDACKRIENGEVRLAELAMCIRKDESLLNQLATLAPPSNVEDATSKSAKYPLSAANHCRVFRCDVSRIFIHMLVRAAKNCSDESGAKFVFWIGQVSLTGLKTAPPKDIVIANGVGGTKTSDGHDHCIIRDGDLEKMKHTPPKTFADIGITRGSELCAEEVATTPKPTTTIAYHFAEDKANFKVAMEAAIDDLHNDLYWETSFAQRITPAFCHFVLLFVLVLFL